MCENSCRSLTFKRTLAISSATVQHSNGWLTSTRSNKHARSGITSDPNGYSDDDKYIVNLVECVVRVGVETTRIVT